MHITRDIRPISALKRDSAALLKQLEETKAPEVPTRNGEPKYVIQGAGARQELIDAQRRSDDLPTQDNPQGERRSPLLRKKPHFVLDAPPGTAVKPAL